MKFIAKDILTYTITDFLSSRKHSPLTQAPPLSRISDNTHDKLRKYLLYVDFTISQILNQKTQNQSTNQAEVV